MAWDYYDRYYPPSKPREVKGGIKAHSQRGAFGQSWWAKRWINVLEGFNIGSRLSRGRSYARNGQVVSIDIGSGLVTAKVQGSSPKPYSVHIKVSSLDQQDEIKLAGVLSSQVLFAAKLLAGEMPQDIEQVFTASGLSLFPEHSSDLETDCSCPDWSNPCKHVAAVYYLIGEEFDRDPFLLFKLRGIDRERLLSLLSLSGEGESEEGDLRANATDKATKRTSRSKSSSDLVTGKSSHKRATTASPSKSASATTNVNEIVPALEPLSCNAVAFWQGSGLSDDFLGEVLTPPVNAALLKRLGNFPFWRGNQRLMDKLEPLYEQAGRTGLKLAAGEMTENDDLIRNT